MREVEEERRGKGRGGKAGGRRETWEEENVGCERKRKSKCGACVTRRVEGTKPKGECRPAAADIG